MPREDAAAFHAAARDVFRQVDHRGRVMDVVLPQEPRAELVRVRAGNRGCRDGEETGRDPRCAAPPRPPSGRWLAAPPSRDPRRASPRPRRRDCPRRGRRPRASGRSCAPPAAPGSGSRRPARRSPSCRRSPPRRGRRRDRPDPPFPRRRRRDSSASRALDEREQASERRACAGGTTPCGCPGRSSTSLSETKRARV